MNCALRIGTTENPNDLAKSIGRLLIKKSKHPKFSTSSHHWDPLLFNALEVEFIQGKKLHYISDKLQTWNSGEERLRCNDGGCLGGGACSCSCIRFALLLFLVSALVLKSLARRAGGSSVSHLHESGDELS